MKSIKLMSAVLCFSALFAFAADEPAKADAAEKEEPASVELSGDPQNAIMEMLNKPASAEDVAKALAFVPEVAGQAGDYKVTRKDIVDELIKGGISEYILSMMPEDSLRGQIEDIVNEMLTKHVLLEKAKKAGFAVNNETVLKTFDESLAKLTEEQRKEVIDELKARENKTLDDLKAELAKDTVIQEKAAIAAYLDKEVLSKNEKAITDKDVEKFYNENKKDFEIPATISVSHILVAFDEEAKDEAAADKEAKAKIDAIAAELAKDPSKFEALAKEKSDCPSGKADEGKLPEFAEDGTMPTMGGAMIPEFASASFKLAKDGEISAPVKTSYGYHIIRRNKMNKAGAIELDKVKDDVKAYLVDKKNAEDVDKLIEQAMKDAGAKVNEFAPAKKEQKKADDVKVEVDKLI